MPRASIYSIVSCLVCFALSGYGLLLISANEAQVDLLRSTMEHDGCKRFGTFAKKDDPTFMVANATCFSVCHIVADLFKESYPSLPRIVVAGECRHSLTLTYKCMCKFAHGLFTWHSLRKTVKHFLDDVIVVD